jgi:hypothetical protein
MGLLKKIGKRIKRVFRGVKKVFKKVTKFVGRAMKSKWGRALMIAATIFTMGAAAGLWGGFGAAGAAAGGAAGAASGGGATAGGFFSKFVTGAKNFLGVGKGAGAAAAAGPGSALAAPAATAAVDPAVAAYLGQTVAPAVTNAAAPGLMARAGSAAMNFLKSPAGGTVAGSMISGYAQGKQQEAMLEEEERRARYYDAAWRDPSQLTQLHDAASADILTPTGFMNRARRVTQYLDERANRYPVVPGNPAQMMEYARPSGG